MKIITIFILFLGAIASTGYAQVTGHVYEIDDHGHKEPLIGVSVYWLGTTQSTTSDKKGKFNLEPTNYSYKLVFSYIGYKTDTISWVSGQKTKLELIMQPDVTSIDEVVKTARVKGESLSKVNPIYTTNISSAGLKKAACCNLGESFQNSSSVDVTYSDAITGAKQIQMLGLAGTYSQLLTENIPNMRGLATSYGLTYIPGSWMESIQISKGVTSVRNGYEAVTGQVNTEFKKPDGGEKLFVNGFADSEERFEINSNYSTRIGEKWGTTFFVHTNQMKNKLDHNSDNFLDHPLVTQYNFYNKWNYEGEVIESKIGFKYLQEDRSAGQLNFNQSQPKNLNNGFGIGINTNRQELYAKTGYISPGRENTSLALIVSATSHNQKSFYGLNTYNANQNSVYSNLIFVTYIGNTDHTIATGLSATSDWYDENLNNLDLGRIEYVQGGYAEYTYKPSEQFTAIAGTRVDENSRFGAFVTPRIHVKYNPIHDITLRTSAGKGFRSPSPIAENTYLLVSSKQINFAENIKMEEAWNYGISAAWQPEDNAQRFTIGADYFRTDFNNQLIVDVEQIAGQIIFYNLKGKSYSNSWQIESSAELFKNFNIAAAYRINDVKITVNNKLVQKPLTNKTKALLTLDYATLNNNWQFNYTLQYNGGGRLPDSYVAENTLLTNRTFPAYYIMHAQVTYKYKSIDIYLGGENLTGYMQKNPIIASNEPFGRFFDASQVWAPLTGAMFYTGFRYTLGKK